MRNSSIAVGVICPAPIEYRICRDLMKLRHELEISGRWISFKSWKGIKFVAIQAGPGKIQSASATQFIIDRFQPGIIMDAGGAGSLSSKIKIFDVVCAEHAYEYDICDFRQFNHFAKDLTSGTILCDLSIEEKNIFNQFMEQVKRKKSIGFEIGNIASGERNVNDRTMRKKLHSTFQAIACNWETSAILKTAQLNKVKAISFRVISDNATEEMSKEFNANWEKALKILYPVLEEFLFEGWLFRILKSLPR